jgi:hypothetical protein
MGRSVNYLNNSERVNYFEWPTLWAYDEETDKDIKTDEYEEASFVIEDIQEYITSLFPEFEKCSRWEGNEVHIILEGYGLEIGLSEYCGLTSLSVRIDQSILDYFDTDEEAEEEYQKCLTWINDNWDEASKYWNRYRKIGTFSNGEGVFEKTN